MIEKMRTVHLVCLNDDRQQALEELRRLEIMHVKAEKGADSRDLADLRRRVENIEECITALSSRQAPKDGFDYSEQTLELDPARMSQRVHQLVVNLARKREEREHWRRLRSNLEPWGDFDPALVRSLRDKGLDVTFCICPETQVPSLPDFALMQEITRRNGQVFFVVIADQELDCELPEVTVPLDDSMAEIEVSLADCEETLESIERELSRLSCFLPAIKEIHLQRLEEVEFLETRDAMAQPGQDLACLSGYIPAKREEELSQAAHNYGWALLTTPVDPEDHHIPTMITIPKWLEISRPIFDFVGIAPGYDEFDISGWFLVFLTIFFAMIVGDAGYGALFLVLTIIAKAKLRGKFRTQLNLILLFSVATIIWGALTGSYFGIAKNLGITPPAPIPWFNVPDVLKNQRLMFLCFVLGAVHLSIAHIWKAILAINSVQALSQIGWLVIVWANSFLASMLVSPQGSPICPNLTAAHWVPSTLIGMYVVGVVLVIFFSAPSKRPLVMVGKGVGEVLGNGVNSFVDVVSYIRLFAVGLSSFYVANSFNLIAIHQVGFSGVQAIGAILVILFGHTLNIALCVLGVLVHGIRLNTLEFSGHMGLEWRGTQFKPFARRLKERIVQ